MGGEGVAAGGGVAVTVVTYITVSFTSRERYYFSNCQTQHTHSHTQCFTHNGNVKC